MNKLYKHIPKDNLCGISYNFVQLFFEKKTFKDLANRNQIFTFFHFQSFAILGGISILF